MAPYTLIVTEKPDAAARIALALDFAGKPRRQIIDGVPYYEATRERSLVVVPALGHLYTVTAGKGTKGGYPVFAYRWVPLYLANRNAGRTRVWLGAIMQLAKGADEFVDACDFDLEGSIIGYNVLKFACGGREKEAKRMKYSTLTRDELQHAYANVLSSLDFSLIEAGLARHEVDWLYGINLSRALMAAVKKKTKRYVPLSTGRVQGPTLKFVAAREKVIRSFVPAPFWIVTATIIINDQRFEIPHEKNPIQSLEEADSIVKACEGKPGRIERVESLKVSIPPPTPFDLGTLQNEAYRLFRYSPIFSLKVAQRIYLDALISYPRTSSQKLPPAIGYKAILDKLAKSSEHGPNARKLLSMPVLKPREGKGFDPAHPAIYPTGNLPERALDNAEKRLWNLIVKRFIAAFGENAVQLVVKASVDVDGNKFLLEGCENIELGWQQIYKPYITSKDKPIPRVVNGQEVDVSQIAANRQLTKPPSRYNPGTLLKKMQQANLGTKATRASIIQTLYDRKYIANEAISTTELGFQVVDVLMKYCPAILSSALTAELEEKMNAIGQRKQTREQIVSEAIENLKTVTTKLKESEDAIGTELAEALQTSRLAERIVGSCPNCKTGKLVIIRSRKTLKRFVGCTNYFIGTCKTAFPVPQQGVLKPLRRICPNCGLPVIQVLKSRRPWLLCLNPDCPSKRQRQY